MSLLSPEEPTLFGNHTFGDIPVLAERVKKLRASTVEKRNKHLQTMEASVGDKSPCIPWNKNGANCLYTTLSKFKKTEPSIVPVAGNMQFANKADKYGYANQGFEQVSLLDAVPGDLAQIWNYDWGGNIEYPSHMMTLAEKAKDPNDNQYIYAGGTAGTPIRKNTYPANIKAYRFIGKELSQNQDKVGLIEKYLPSVMNQISQLPPITNVTL